MFKKEIGKRIREIRQEKNITREKLADEADITTKFLYEIENGKKGVSAKTLLKIATALSCSCDYILLGVNKTEEQGRETFNIGLLKGCSEKQYENIMEILCLLMELKENMDKHEL